MRESGGCVGWFDRHVMGLRGLGPPRGKAGKGRGVLGFEGGSNPTVVVLGGRSDGKGWFWWLCSGLKEKAWGRIVSGSAEEGLWRASSNCISGFRPKMKQLRNASLDKPVTQLLIFSNSVWLRGRSKVGKRIFGGRGWFCGGGGGGGGGGSGGCCRLAGLVRNVVRLLMAAVCSDMVADWVVMWVIRTLRSSSYQFKKAIKLTATDRTQAKFTLPDIKKLSAEVKDRTFLILLVTFDDHTNPNEMNRTKDHMLTQCKTGDCVMGKVLIADFLHLTCETPNLSLGEKLQSRSTVSMKSCRIKATFLDVVTFQFPYKSDSVQVPVVVTAEEVGAKSIDNNIPTNLLTPGLGY
nr:hypothetical protein [Tanacetum cinerariifolium]